MKGIRFERSVCTTALALPSLEIATERMNGPPAGQRAAAAGFTLIELLVVLAIMALLLGVVPALLSGTRSSLEFRSAVRDLANDMRAARGIAVATDRETLFSLDVAKGVYSVSPGGEPHRLPKGVALRFRGPAAEASGKQAAIRFFPDGSSTGGAVWLSFDGREHRVAAHWLTGRISVDD